ncbi:MAG: phosphoribosylamine--glycine ligase [Candidatus Infernicultor aquiphilus]|uniref:Phosphoribosylamine--glycine ligase n=1 Tax=Candidatus Infernicultor aquiphilus TaxID=1805029 RepID=A0A1J5GVU3_9BACT|nr:MAG: phosphoribosylamine--glycine ligase [Candidatus Atribacteria bacterium CG2_30_33_13]PIU25463.1 MAG: phosphoribosylamine--glycine ligase [Candidatus Atribacteria bacterium CG08_land_8_20_14_0_20_33_29]PIX34789.1 MAG: phosphoribosylamine--glycine ligase [Candidatus Atribacteria bacterium CG_4_8_14_3_um_filter_34_18]PIY33122.1 MAG: phosphoribosylamine--glycine ligase [Candidatus Atribacteria bacterium CG_4_10_14_3_um_filter_34_13]
MKILVIGSGGREHTLVWKISQSPKVSKIFCAPGNAGISHLAQCVDIGEDNMVGLANFAQKMKIDLTIVGPELPLSRGIVDEFDKLGLKIFGPNQKATQIESSKVFSKYLMKKYNIPSASYAVFQDIKQAFDYVKQQAFPLVIKADGLAAGKGVFIVQGIKQAQEALDSLMKKKIFGDAGEYVVIEEFLEGEEISILAFSDGKTVLPMVPSQDHKKIFNQDKGPNTGGMGAYSPVPFYNDLSRETVLQKILKPTIEGLKKEGREYKGVLYAGLILTKEGPKVLEFNARFGDPETQVVLPRLETDLIEIFNAVIEGNLHKINLKWKDNAVVCVVIASGGYPGKYQKGKVIGGLKNLEEMKDIIAFHAGTKLQDEKVVSSGGRVLGITAWADTIFKAKEKAYEGVEKIYFEEMYYRKDIALKGIK